MSRDETQDAESSAQTARRLNAWLANADAATVLKVALENEFHGQTAMVSSFGIESAVLLHMVSRVDPATPIIFLDTDYLFTKTLHYRDHLIERLGLSDVRAIKPDQDEIARSDPKGDLWRRDPDACCAARRVAPLAGALKGFSAWITGRKRFQGNLRAFLPVVEAAQGRVKFNPLARWSQAEIDAYFARHDLPRHELEARGFRSVGCWPCTAPSDDAADPRAGRWAGAEKTECGIHLAN